MKVFELSPSSDASLTDVSRALGNIVDPHGEQKDQKPGDWFSCCSKTLSYFVG